MNNSLQHRLSIGLGMVIVAAGIIAAGISFWLAFDEAQEFQDGSLRQIAVLLDADLLPVRGQRAAAGIDNDPEARIVVQRLTPPAGTGVGVLSLPADLAAGFHTRDVNGSGWRIYVRSLRNGTRIAVAQETQVRAEAASDGALRTLFPVIALIPLLAFLSRWLVRASLAPVRTLAHVADTQPEDHPAPLPTDGVPDEIAPFVQSINRLLERVHRLISQQRRFIADAAHELRTPLTALSVQAQNVRQATSIETARERVVSLLAGIERARQLTEQLLSLARTQAIETADTQVSVSALARELIAEYLSLAEARKIDLGLEEVATLSVRAAPESLRLIIKNALENALKYTPDGGEVTLRLLEEGNDALIEVIDNGPGIPAEARERAFDPFYRMPAAAGEGSGLGLAIAREAASRLGGVVSLHERAGRSGLVFRYRQRRDT